MPVHLRDDCGDLLGVDLFLDHRAAGGLPLRERRLGVGQALLEVAQVAVLDPCGRLEVAAALRLLELDLLGVDLLAGAS